jgi:chemotaxis protein MotB
MANKEQATIIIKKKKGGGHGHHGGAWKVAYADFVTAMMAFFLVMWLMGTDEETKAAIQGYFQNAGSTSPISVSPNDPKGGDKLNVFNDSGQAGGRPMDMPAGKVNTQAEQDKEIQAIKEQLEESISLELGVANPSEKLEMVYDSKGLVLRIAVKNFFEHGQSDLKPDLLPVLFRIGKTLAGIHHNIRIEGHTEISEMARDGRSPAWDLSTARASAVAAYWMKSFPSMKPERLEIAGQAHFHPIADENTPQGRAADRRVDIIVLNEQYK